MKIARQSQIVSFIKNNEIETQIELVNMLRENGLDVTQSTISRDIRELGVIKLNKADGRQIYQIVDETEKKSNHKLIVILKEAIISLDYANNLVVIKTLIGMAMAVATSIDSMCYKNILGTIAGDDNVVCIVKTEAEAITFIKNIKKLII